MAAMKVWVVVTVKGMGVVDDLIKAFTNEGDADRFRDWCEAEVHRLRRQIVDGKVDLDHPLAQYIGMRFRVVPSISLVLGNGTFDGLSPTGVVIDDEDADKWLEGFAPGSKP